MSKCLNITTLFIVLLFSFKTFALESSDEFKTQILKIYNKNILVINRGLEDAIFKKDHAKLTSDDGFIARGICIKATLLTSHWKIYRVVRPQLVSKDTSYILKSINQSEIPKQLIKYSKVDFEKYFKDYGDSNRTKQLKLQNKRVAKYDLPTDTKSIVNRDKVESLTGIDRYVETNFKENQFIKDLSNTYVELYADPISWETRDDKAEFVFGGAIFNYGKKYQYSFHFDEDQLKYPDFSERYTHYDFNFNVLDFAENFSIISNFEYDREFDGNRFFPIRRQQIGIIGIRYHFWKNNDRTDFGDISYLPTHDFFEYIDPSDESRKTRSGIRHVFTLRMNTPLSKRLLWKNKLIWRPMSSFQSDDEKTSDNPNPYLNSNIGYSVGKGFSLEYDVTYQRDKLLKEVFNDRAENISSNVQIRYEFQI